jgi:hypothetical protein
LLAHTGRSHSNVIQTGLRAESKSGKTWQKHTKYLAIKEDENGTIWSWNGVLLESRAQKIQPHHVLNPHPRLTIFTVKLDPEKFFQDIFGGERFYDLIGMSSVGKAIGEAMHNPMSDSDPPERSPAEKAEDEAREAKERAERVSMLVDNLCYKLDLFALDEDREARIDRWRTRCKAEADELKNERFGPEILRVRST